MASSNTSDVWLTPSLILTLKKAHGSLMVTAWVFCSTIAILIARYFRKSTFGQKMVAGKQLWFQVYKLVEIYYCVIPCLTIRHIAH